MSELVTQEEITEEDYRAIEEAVMETARGRWFLKEYAKRNRVSDTETVLEAVEGLKSYISRSDEPADVLQMRLDIVDMTHTIDQLKAEINSFDPQSPDGHFKDAQNQLSVVVDETEQATSSILAAAENVQQVAWEMRDEGGFPHFCDKLDELATEIYTSCSFQDLTGQRLRKVVDVTAFLEDRLRTMIAVWDDSQETSNVTGSGYAPFDAGLENGPAMPGQGQGQSDIDVMLSADEEAPSEEDHFELTWADDEDEDFESDPFVNEDGYQEPLVTADLSLEPGNAGEVEPELSSTSFDNVDMDLTAIPEVSHDHSETSDAIEEAESLSSTAEQLDEPDQELVSEPESETSSENQALSEAANHPDEDTLDADIETLDGAIAGEDVLETITSNPASLEIEADAEEVEEHSLPLIQRQVMFS